ncbi:uncharacterized protein [Pyrus communis]|uniref:uncharacterized protein n=1 Tax=Pyrus communis TaxID=23211 RepID=UPI0035C0201B
MLMQGSRMYVPNIAELKKDILDEAHISAYAMHPGSTKMYHTIRPFYYSPGMKREIAEFVSRCAICQQVKAERKKPFGLMQPLLVPYHGFRVQASSYTKWLRRHLGGIVKYHGVPVSIISDWDPRFTSKFWVAFQEALEVGERMLVCLEIVDETTHNIQVIKANLKAAQGRQKSLADKHATDRVYKVGDWVFLKLSLWKGFVRFGKKGKLSLRYIGPYQITERVGEVAYRLELPPELLRVHDVFHVSMLRHYVSDSLHVIPLQPLEINPDLTYDEEPVTILDWKDKVLRNKTVRMVKVL